MKSLSPQVLGKPLFYLSIILLTVCYLHPSKVFGAAFLQIKFADSTGTDAKSAKADLRQLNKLLYMDLKELVKGVDLSYNIDSERQSFQFDINSVPCKLMADNVFFMIGDKIYQLPLEVLFIEGKYWAPLESFLALFRSTYIGDLIYDRDSMTIFLRPGHFDIYTIQFDRKENGTLLRLSTTRNFDISGTSISNGYLSFTVMDAKVNSKALEQTPPTGAVSQLIIHQHPNSVQFSFKLTSEIIDHNLWQEQNPFQIVVSLVTQIISVQTLADSVPTSADSLAILLEREQKKWKIDCVVIDPGHGGKDPGAVGPSGLREKEVTLDVALALKQLLKSKSDLKVILTRQDDRFIPLSDRTSKANQSGGKLFLSIHCNSAKQKKAHGFETYFLKPARNERAMEVALLENSVIKYEESKNQYQDLTEENYILLAMAQAEFVRESETLADIIQTSLSEKTQLSNRGVDQAGFYVLVGASMPAVLVEMPFISNKAEEKLLKKKDFRQKLAEALFTSILDFKQRGERTQQTTKFTEP